MAIVPGIYIILNTKNGKVYLGQTQNIRIRWNRHKRDLIKGNHPNKHLQLAWNKYGEKAFQFKILERCEVDKLNEREGHFIQIYKAKGIAYNVSDYANAPNRGKTFNSEH